MKEKNNNYPRCFTNKGYKGSKGKTILVPLLNEIEFLCHVVAHDRTLVVYCDFMCKTTSLHMELNKHKAFTVKELCQWQI